MRYVRDRCSRYRIACEIYNMTRKRNIKTYTMALITQLLNRELMGKIGRAYDIKNGEKIVINKYPNTKVLYYNKVFRFVWAKLVTK